MNINELFSYHTDDRKYSEAKEWLQNNSLVTSEYKKLVREVVSCLAYNLTNSRDLRLGLSASDDAAEVWAVPCPRCNESPRGFISRLRAWMNLFMAWNTRHDASGWHTPARINVRLLDEEVDAE